MYIYLYNEIRNCIVESCYKMKIYDKNFLYIKDNQCQYIPNMSKWFGCSPFFDQKMTQYRLNLLAKIKTTFKSLLFHLSFNLKSFILRSVVHPLYIVIVERMQVNKSIHQVRFWHSFYFRLRKYFTACKFVIFASYAEYESIVNN